MQAKGRPEKLGYLTDNAGSNFRFRWLPEPAGSGAGSPPARS
jgi:hypothetical protein